jgi:ABC-2 type transport system permease protein
MNAAVTSTQEPGPQPPSLVGKGARGLGLDFSALGALMVLSLRGAFRIKRMLVLAILFTLPVVIACIAKAKAPPRELPDVELALVFMMLPHVLIPLTALLFGSGMIQDEIEDQTLTYLLIRPLPRWSIYVGKLLATLVAAGMLAVVFATTSMLIIWWGDDRFTTALLAERIGKTVLLHLFALAGYISVFGLASLLIKRTLVVGMIYIVVLEGFVANIPFVVRQMTVMYYFRVLAMRWLELAGEAPRLWNIDLTTATSASDCVWTLGGIIGGATLAAAYLFTYREFRMKTPEGN